MIRRAIFAGLAVVPCVTWAGDDETELLAVLAEQTALATKTRLNVDYVPGIVDVLRGKELADHGARTVWDALSFVPGVVPVTDQLGHRRVTIRGLGSIGDNWAAGYVKLLLNGVPVNTDDRGLADPVFYIPVAQIELIEVIRGPGSAVHGENAVAGVINILTRQDETMAFLSTGDFSEVGGGAMASGSSGDWRYSINWGAWGRNRSGVITGPDAAYQSGLAAYSHAPGPVNDPMGSHNLVGQVAYKGFSLLSQWTQSRIGDSYGVNYVLPPAQDRSVETSTIGTTEARYQTRIGSSADVDVYLGERRYLLRKDQLFAGPAAYYGIQSGQDIHVDVDYEEARSYYGASLRLENGAHRWLFGAEDAHTEVKQGSQSFNLFCDPVTHACSIPSVPVEYGYLVPAGTTRRVSSATIQDEYRWSDLLSLTGGARYDNFSSVGGHLSPRLAAVWRFEEADVIKAQYGNAFRAPTLTELAYGNRVAPVTVDTAELAYIHKLPRAEFRATSAYSRLQDIIVFRPDLHAFANADSARIATVELDALVQPTSNWKLTGALSYADTHMDADGGAIPGSSKWVGRAGAQYQRDSYTVDLQGFHVSDFARQPADTRNTVGFTSVDLTGTLRATHGLILRAGLKNLFDADVRYPAFLGTSGSGESVISYPNDLLQPGRTWWAEISATF